MSFNSLPPSPLSIHNNLNKSFLCSVIEEIRPNRSKNAALIFNKFYFIKFRFKGIISSKSNTNQSFSMRQLIPNTFLNPKQFLSCSQLLSFSSTQILSVNSLLLEFHFRSSKPPSFKYFFNSKQNSKPSSIVTYCNIINMHKL